MILTLKARFGLVIGSEGEGISRLVREKMRLHSKAYLWQAKLIHLMRRLRQVF